MFDRLHTKEIKNVRKAAAIKKAISYEQAWDPSSASSPPRSMAAALFDRLCKTNTTRSNAGNRSTPTAEDKTSSSMINIESPLPAYKTALQSLKTSMIEEEGRKQSPESENGERQNTARARPQIQYVDTILFDEQFLDAKMISKTSRNMKNPSQKLLIYANGIDTEEVHIRRRNEGFTGEEENQVEYNVTNFSSAHSGEQKHLEDNGEDEEEKCD